MDTPTCNESNLTPLLISRREAALRYGLSQRSLDTLLSEGVIPRVAFSKRCVRIPVEQADKVVMARVTGGTMPRA